MAVRLFLIGGMALLLAGPVAAQTAQRGKLLFLRCASCHALAESAVARTGPNLHGVFGRKAGSLADFKYSAALRDSNLVWDAATLDRWLTRPVDLVPGTAMAFAGMPLAEDRQALIAYLREAP